MEVLSKQPKSLSYLQLQSSCAQPILLLHATSCSTAWLRPQEQRSSRQPALTCSELQCLTSVPLHDLAIV